MSSKINDQAVKLKSARHTTTQSISPFDQYQFTTDNISKSWCCFSWRDQIVAQAPTYPDDDKLLQAEDVLRHVAPIIEFKEIENLKLALAAVKQHHGFVLQIGDCAETFRHSDIAYTTQRIFLFSELHKIVQKHLCGPVVTMGRMAGQFAKPRSRMTEIINNVEVSSYFGDVVNDFDFKHREPDPERLIIGHQVAFDTVHIARLYSHTWSLFDTNPFLFGEHFFTCHEAYLLPYEQNLLRLEYLQYEDVTLHAITAKNIPNSFGDQQHYFIDKSNAPLSPTSLPYTVTHAQKNTYGDEVSASLHAAAQSIHPHHVVYSSSAHYLWIGDRTKKMNSGHIEFVKHLYNPIGVKIGPSSTQEELIELIRELNPTGELGKLSFIFRLGRDKIHKLENFAAFICEHKLQDHVLWICDPMHGNTIKTENGLKTRKLSYVLDEVVAFYKILNAYNIEVNGIHLELTPHSVYECLDMGDTENSLSEELFLSTCDPRLNSGQAMFIIEMIAQLSNTFSADGHENAVESQ